MSPKFVLILCCLLPLAVLGQTTTIVTPYNPITQSVPVGLVYYPEKNVIAPGGLRFSTAWKEAFGQSLYNEPISLKGMIRRDDNKMGASATGGLVYTGGDDVFEPRDGVVQLSSFSQGNTEVILDRRRAWIPRNIVAPKRLVILIGPCPLPAQKPKNQQ